MALRRHTKQRDALLQILRELKTHPTALELYGLLRSRLPRLSLGTVYRNLEALARDGLIRKLVSGHEEARFDGDLSRHHHVRCIECGRVADIRGLVADNIRTTEVGCLTGFEVLGHRLEFFGLCPKCQAHRSVPGGASGQVENDIGTSPGREASEAIRA
jgi:Fur family ferric uptake transcriptional regulator